MFSEVYCEWLGYEEVIIKNMVSGGYRRKGFYEVGDYRLGFG
jgi:hypothetical protein